MTSILWMVCLTLVLVAVQAEAWLPNRLVKFRLRRRKRPAVEKNTRSDENAEGDNTVATATDNDDDNDSEASERKLLSLLPWWEDSWSEAFMNSFPLSPSSVLATATSSSTDSATTIEQSLEDELSHYETYKPNPSAQVLHFCFLLHGHRGFSTDLSYLQRVMQHHAELEKRKEQDNNKQQQHDMIVHCAVCNEGKTMDGVINGGERMVQEILQVIRSELEKRRKNQDDNHQEAQDITISVVGNSLGGIYGRYAIARLVQLAADQENHPELTPVSSFSEGDDKQQEEDSASLSSTVLLDGKYRLHFNIFCTTATPHLGISKHTYVPVPRSVEIGAAHALGETGRDLFRLNDLLKTMATCPTYLEPLRQFKKRIALANAYQTDFPVPASTAAFLSSQSTSPHHFATNDTNTQPQQQHKFVVATLHTPASKALPKFAEEEAIVDDLVQMSSSLDSLGWKKVFIDVRKEIPLRVVLPRSAADIRKKITETSLLLTPKRLLRRSFSDVTPETSASNEAGDTINATGSSHMHHAKTAPSSPQSGNSDDEAEDNDRPRQEESAIHRLRQKGIVESRDVASVVSTPEDMKLSFPLGHNLMVALARDGYTGGIYKGGRPVMDSLAQELVHDIFDWNFEEEEEEKAALLQQSSTSTSVLPRNVE